jgi:hypothetical protein
MEITIILSISQIRKLRVIKIQSFAQKHATHKWWSKALSHVPCPQNWFSSPCVYNDPHLLILNREHGVTRTAEAAEYHVQAESELALLSELLTTAPRVFQPPYHSPSIPWRASISHAQQRVRPSPVHIRKLQLSESRQFAKAIHI